MTHRTHMRFLWHTWACSYNDTHSQTLTSETCSQSSRSYWQYVKRLVCAVVQKLLVCLGFLASFIFFKNTPVQGPLTPSCSTRMSTYKSCQTRAQTRKQASTNSSGYRNICTDLQFEVTFDYETLKLTRPLFEKWRLYCTFLSCYAFNVLQGPKCLKVCFYCLFKLWPFLCWYLSVICVSQLPQVLYVIDLD